MFFIGNLGSREKNRWYHTGFSKLLLCLAVALLTLALLPFVSQAATFDLGGNLGLSSSSDPITETDLRAGKDASNKKLTITLTLVGNNWADDVESTAKLKTLIDGLASLLDDDALQWEKVKAALKEKAQSSAKANFFKYDITTNSIEITLPKINDYDISTDQIIGVSIAPSLLSDSSNQVLVTKDFTIIADSQASLINNLKSAADIVNGGGIISLSLTNNTWDKSIFDNTSKRNTFFGYFTTTNEKTEWNKVIQALKAYPDPAKILAISDDKKTLTITLPSAPDYQITEEQTIKVNHKNWHSQGFIADKLASSQTALAFVITPSFTTATLGGTIINHPTESNIVAGGQTIEIKLSGNNEWQGNIVSNQAMINTLVDGFTATSEADSWNRVKSELKSQAIADSKLKLNDAKTLTITLPATAKYEITADQTINVKINATLLKYNHSVNVTPDTFLIKADGAATVTGTVAPLLTETDMISGGKTIIITLTNHKWIPDVVSKASNRNLLMDGFEVVNDKSEAAQWDYALEVIKASATFTRISDIVVSITLPRSDGFNIEKIMELHLTVPGSLIDATSVADLGRIYAFKITPVTTQVAKLSGTAVNGIIENDIVTGGKTIVITLDDDTWVSDLATNSTLCNDLLTGFYASGDSSDVIAWNNARTYFKNSSSTKIVRDSDTVVTITLPAYAGFAIANNLSITLDIPKSVLTTASKKVTSGSFTISAITATVSGTAITAMTDSKSIIAGGKTLIITLKNATWATNVVTRYEDLLDAFYSDDSFEWKKIKKKITAANVVRNSNTVVTIKLPPVPDYSGDNQSITIVVPQALTTGGERDITATPSLQIGSTASARLSGNKIAKSSIIYGGDVIYITLSDCTWAEDVVSNTNKLKSLLKGFTADTDTANWNLVMNALQANLENIERVSDKKLSIELPPVPKYDPINEQRISLTIPKNLLVGVNDNVVTDNEIIISLPSGYYQGTLQYLLDYDILNHYINTKPLEDIFLQVPVKYINNVVVGQTKLDNSVITSMDIYTDSSVNKVSVTVNGDVYTTRNWVEDGQMNKFNIGFAYNTTAARDAATGTDAIISVSDRNIRLQNDVTIKINGSQTHSLAPKADLKGTYSLYKLVNDSKMFTSILDYYIPADIKMQTLTP